MAADLLVDTSGLYALADHRDPLCRSARQHVEVRVHSGSRLIVSGYDFRRGLHPREGAGGRPRSLTTPDLVESVEWIGPDRFELAKDYFRKYADHGFTDCTTFIVMKELKLREALTSDRHFVEAGCRALLLNGSRA